MAKENDGDSEPGEAYIKALTKLQKAALKVVEKIFNDAPDHDSWVAVMWELGIDPRD